ncbi:MAG: HD domain-containing protein, partial [Halohasta sp.]
TVYMHPVARISKAMLRRATERLIEETAIDAERVRRMDDHDLLVALRQTPETEDFAERYGSRRLLKRAVWAELQHVPDSLLAADHERIRELESTVADRAELPATDVIIEIPAEPTMRESTSRVVVGGEIRDLGAQSPLVGALRTAQRGQWRLGVYTRPEATERVGRLAAETLGLELPDGLIRERHRGLHATLDEFE